MRAPVPAQTLELSLEVPEARLAHCLADGTELMASVGAAGRGGGGGRGVQVNSEPSFFCGYCWSIKLVFGL
eukprot:157636-Chlamydomonas_euryale.AAC.1